LRADRVDAVDGVCSDQGVLISATPDVIKMLADPLRLQIIELLADGPACVCHLVEDTGAKQPNVSNHLRVLREAGLVVAEPHGRFTYYRLLPDAVAATAAQLSQLAGRAEANAESRREC
jgi:ArsR family transcriptional regulator, arsenate/arsenite/antimonite-responsive transcriptional repressor